MKNVDARVAAEAVKAAWPYVKEAGEAMGNAMEGEKIAQEMNAMADPSLNPEGLYDRMATLIEGSAGSDEWKLEQMYRLNEQRIRDRERAAEILHAERIRKLRIAGYVLSGGLTYIPRLLDGNKNGRLLQSGEELPS